VILEVFSFLLSEPVSLYILFVLSIRMDKGGDRVKAGVEIKNSRKQNRKAKSFLNDLQGLSDAVTVAIFLSIVLVVAGVIGGLVLSKVPTGTVPTATISIQGLGSRVVISHNGGDGIPADQLRLYVYDQNMSIVSGYPITVSSVAAANKTDTNPANVFNNGDNVRITLSPGTYKIAVEYVPTQQMIASGWVTISL